MGKSKRDGFYRRGKVWWTRDPVTKRRASTRCTDLEAARRWRAARERTAADPAHAASEEAKLGEWCGRFVTWKEKTKSAATAAVARQKLGHWARIFGDDAPLSLFAEPGTFDRYVETRRAEDVTDHTISKEVSHMLAVLKLAKRGKCFAGDISTLRPPDLHAGYEPRKRALTRTELAALLAQLEPRRGALVAVCVALGCRLSEAHRLLPTDIEGSVVHVRGTKRPGARRTLPILDFYRPLLEHALPWLPLEPWGKVQRDLGVACRRAGIDRCTPNDLRRTHATLMVEAGVDRDTIRRLLGHTTTAMVDRVYGQPKPEALAKLAGDKLRGAEPLPEVQGRHSEAVHETGADSEVTDPKDKAPVAQWIEQRFPKPISHHPEHSGKPARARKHAGLARVGAAGRGTKTGGLGTRTSQPVGAGGAAEVWPSRARVFRAQSWLWFARRSALASAARDVGVIRG